MCQYRIPASCLLLVIGFFVSVTGCATSYHDYEGCCIPYRYCTPAPLPHTFYAGCRCPTPVASHYTQGPGTLSADSAAEAR